MVHGLVRIYGILISPSPEPTYEYISFANVTHSIAPSARLFVTKGKRSRYQSNSQLRVPLANNPQLDKGLKAEAEFIHPADQSVAIFDAILVHSRLIYFSKRRVASLRRYDIERKCTYCYASDGLIGTAVLLSQSLPFKQKDIIKRAAISL